MKKVTAIVLALLMVLSLAACGSAASESKTLVMATSADYPPYEFIVLNDKNEQQYVGIDVSVSEAIAADMGKELQIVNMDFDSLMDALQKGDADIAFIQGGIEETLGEDDESSLRSLGSVSYEPVWVFYRSEHRIDKQRVRLERLFGILRRMRRRNGKSKWQAKRGQSGERCHRRRPSLGAEAGFVRSVARGRCAFDAPL